jgi:hypothetical protein
MSNSNGYMQIRTWVAMWALLSLASCGGSVDKVIVKTPIPYSCKTPQKITAIYPEYVYDISGYADVVGPAAYALFDENSFSDPKSPGDFKPITGVHPQYGSPTYFRDYGSRIVVDLRVPYKLSEIYLYDRARYSDTVYIYTGTMKNWKLKATIATTGDPAMWGWRRFAVSDSTRFVMFKFRSHEADVSEAVMYGCAYETPPPRPPTQYTGPRLEPKMFKEFLGVNCYQETPTRFMKPFYYSRMYTFSAGADDDTVNAYPNNKYNINPHGWYNNGINDYVFYADSMKQMGNKVWYCFLGVPLWLSRIKYPNDNRPVTHLGQRMDDPVTYARHAKMFWHMAAAYGANPVDTSLFEFKSQHVFSGRNVMNIYENGNELDAFGGENYCTPLEYFALSTADYDGDEGRLGPKHGLKQADSTAELMMAGMTRFDINRLRVLKFLCNTLRSDSQFLWNGGIQYHWYSSNGTGNSPAKVFKSASAGITPEEDSLRQKLTKARDDTYMVQPGVEVFLGEFGYDKARGSKVSVPLVPGYNQSQSHGIMMIRAINAIFFSGFDRYIIYWIKDNYEETLPVLFLTCGLLRQHDNNIYTIYPAWYYISTMYNHLGNYIPEKIVKEKGDVWVYKYRNKVSPDSAAYFVYCPTHTGKKVDQYNLEVGPVENNTVTELSFKDESTEGTLVNLPVNNNILRVNVSEVPKFIIVKEKK